ncbi:MAG: hypothetical protein U9O89_02535 [Thermoproteota archaeon]|nr:hypothetical protein [Thermoproteota archaeon]
MAQQEKVNEAKPAASSFSIDDKLFVEPFKGNEAIIIYFLIPYSTLCKLSEHYV